MSAGENTPRGRGAVSAKQSEILERRAKVAALVLSGAPQRAMATALGVSLGTINSDLKALRGQWQKSALHDTEMAMLVDIERIESLIRTLWPKAKAGSLYDIDRIVDLINMRKQIFGYAAAQKVQIDGLERVSLVEVVKDYGPPAEDEIVVEGRLAGAAGELLEIAETVRSLALTDEAMNGEMGDLKALASEFAERLKGWKAGQGG